MWQAAAYGCLPPTARTAPPKCAGCACLSPPQVTTEDGAVVLTIERLPEGQPATGLSQRGQYDGNVVWTKKDLQYKSGWVDSWNKMWWVDGAGPCAGLRCQWQPSRWRADGRWPELSPGRQIDTRRLSPCRRRV